MSIRNIVNIGRRILELSDDTSPILRPFPWLADAILLEIEALDDFCPLEKTPDVIERRGFESAGPSPER